MREVVERFSKPESIDEMNERVSMGLFRWEETVVKRSFPVKGRILDIGCGCGREAIRLAEMGYNVTAVDISEAQLEQARINAYKAGVDIEFIKVDGLNMPDRQFDVIILWTQVLGNIEKKEDQLILLMNCVKALKNDGLISASGHYRKNCLKDASPEYIDENWLYPWGKGELKYHLFNVRTLKNYLKKQASKLSQPKYRIHFRL